MDIYINTVKASAEDIKALINNLLEKKDRIKRVVRFKHSTRIYTV